MIPLSSQSVQAAESGAMRYQDATSLFFTADINEIVEGAERRVSSGHRTPGINFHNPKWLGHEQMTSWSNARRIFNSPWTKGMNLLNDMQQKLAGISLPRPTSTRRRMQFNDANGEVCVDRAMRGELEVFRDTSKREVFSSKVLRLIIPMSFSSSVEASDILWNAVAATAVCDIFEESGRMVELCCAFGSIRPFINHNVKNLGVLATLKEAGEPLNAAAAVNCLSPWFFRVFLFAQQDGNGIDVDSGRGMPVYAANSGFFSMMWEKLEVPADTETIMMPNLHSIESTRDFISEMVKLAE